MFKNQNGFSLVELVIILLVFAAISVVGYKLYTNHMGLGVNSGFSRKPANATDNSYNSDGYVSVINQFISDLSRGDYDKANSLINRVALFEGNDSSKYKNIAKDLYSDSSYKYYLSKNYYASSSIQARSVGVMSTFDTSPKDDIEENFTNSSNSNNGPNVLSVIAGYINNKWQITFLSVSGPYTLNNRYMPSASPAASDTPENSYVSGSGYDTGFAVKVDEVTDNPTIPNFNTTNEHYIEVDLTVKNTSQQSININDDFILQLENGHTTKDVQLANNGSITDDSFNLPTFNGKSPVAFTDDNLSPGQSSTQYLIYKINGAFNPQYYKLLWYDNGQTNLPKLAMFDL